MTSNTKNQGGAYNKQERHYHFGYLGVYASWREIGPGNSQFRKSLKSKNEGQGDRERSSVISQLSSKCLSNATWSVCEVDWRIWGIGWSVCRGGRSGFALPSKEGWGFWELPAWFN